MSSRFSLLQEIASNSRKEAPVETVTDLRRELVERTIHHVEELNRTHAYDQALAALSDVRPRLAALGQSDLELEGLLAESWARMMLGEIDTACTLLDDARELAEADAFSDADRAEVLYRMGCCRTKLSKNSDAIALFTVALELCDHSERPSDRLRTQILEWRSRCYRNLRDLEAAWADAERALHLAHELDDGEIAAHVALQASLVAERKGQWHLARFYAEKARDLYTEAGDAVSIGRMLNNLGGLSFLLGRHEDAVAYLKDAFRAALEYGDEVDAAHAVSSLAQVNLRTGDPVSAEQQANHALRLLGARIDFIDEIGNAQLVLGRALLEQGRLEEAEQTFEQAEASFGQLGSISHRAAAWIAQGDLARKSGNGELAADLYRQAAEALQDFHF